MPELPEIETLRRELSPQLEGAILRSVRAYRAGLRWPFPPELLSLTNARILRVERRSKYLMLDLAQGQVIIHLGMSGQLRLVEGDEPLAKHDHLDLILDNGKRLRLRDPRRFGAVLWQARDTVHARLSDLGPEPLSDAFTGASLRKSIGKRSAPIKTVIMDAAVVVGVGNIYATEALFAAKVAPARPANALTSAEATALVKAIRAVLTRGIELGGSSMRDYVHADGSLGGFLGQAKVYGKAGKPCPRCGSLLANMKLGGRNGAWCPHCQV